MYISKDDYDSRCHRFSHFDEETGEPLFVHKIAFDRYSDAVRSMETRNNKKSTTVKVIVYKCPVCGKFHCGGYNYQKSYSRKRNNKEKQRTIARKNARRKYNVENLY